jgi:hypothetical protein
MVLSEYEFKMLQEMNNMNSCFEKILHQIEQVERNTKEISVTMEKSFKANSDVMGIG